jgi:SAM-dependent methyltransferase
MKSLIRQHVPWSLVKRARRLWYLPIDAMETWTGKRPPLTPPRGLRRYVGEGDFAATGAAYVEFLKELVRLEKSESILDVGCGIGRMAVPLTRYLDGNATYAGLDVVREGIEWCRREITPRFPNFHFEFADIRNKQYNPGGTLVASGYRFPYPDRRFDVVFLGSVFTHMLAEDMMHYMGEIARVLKPGGRSFVTYFLIEEESRTHLARGESALDFRFPLGRCWTIDPRVPERAVAYEETLVREMYGRAGLRLSEPIRYGSWSGRPNFFSFQDIVIAVKR